MQKGIRIKLDSIEKGRTGIDTLFPQSDKENCDRPRFSNY